MTKNALVNQRGSVGGMVWAVDAELTSGYTGDAELVLPVATLYGEMLN